MLIQQIAPVAKTEFASVFVALELSRSKWLVGVGTPQKWTVGRHQVEGGDLDGLLALLSRLGAGEEKRSGLPVKVHVCFEAGRDGHWLHRALTTAGYDVYEIDPASVAVDRRARRAKSDGVDVDKLVRTLARLVRGELDACRVVAVPSEAEEDAKRPHREYERLVKEQTSTAAPGGFADHAEAEGGARPPMPSPGRDHRRHRRGRSGDEGGDRRAQEGHPGERGRVAAEPCADQDRPALQAQEHRRPFQHGARRRGLLSNLSQPTRRRAVYRLGPVSLSKRRHGARPGDRQGGLPGDWECQAAKAACGSGSLAGWNLCPKPEPSVPL